MGANLTDLLSMMFLPEILYRFNFPGKVALGAGDLNQPVPPMITKKIRNGWSAEVWGKIYEPNPLKKLWHTWTHKKFLRHSKHGLLSPYPLLDEQVELGWMPARWYSSLWPQMKAFAYLHMLMVTFVLIFKDAIAMVWLHRLNTILFAIALLRFLVVLKMVAADNL
jgi:hypothetical protein